MDRGADAAVRSRASASNGKAPSRYNAPTNPRVRSLTDVPDSRSSANAALRRAAQVARKNIVVLSGLAKKVDASERHHIRACFDESVGAVAGGRLRMETVQ